MTYCPPEPQTQEFEFTAFTGADILAEGDTNLNCGDCFEMPLSATTCITVWDDDTSLSGDAWCNEWGDDYSLQIADIKVNGTLVHDDARIYAEQYYILHDQNGNCYYLIEIEIAGNGGADDTADFYAFYGNLPPSDATLTVVGQANVSGSWLDYREMSAGLKWDFDDAGKLTIEAEDMALRGYRVDDMLAASGGEVIKLKRAEGEASLTFGAESGTYDLELAYVDENDGEGDIEIWIAGVLVETIQLDQNNNGNGNNWSTISTFKIEDIEISQGDDIVLRGTQDAWEFARIDALTFCRNRPPEAQDDVAVTDEDTAVSLNLLENDTDPDGDQITVLSVDGMAANAEFGVQSDQGRSGIVSITTQGVLTFFPTAAFGDMKQDEIDTVSLTYVITDGRGETASATATITVTGINDAPVAVDDVYTVSETDLTVLDILANDSDPEDDVLTFEILNQPIEGSVAVDGNGDVVFDPGSDFLALSDGESATVSFEYRISDGQLTDTATVTVTVLGEGICIPEVITTTGLGTLSDGQDMTVTLDAPEFTKHGTEDFRFTVSLGDTSQDRYNFVFVVDVSGSTGVDDSFGVGTTVLEAEIEALQNLTTDILELGLPEGSFTISVVPFSTTVQIVDFNPNDEDFNFVQTFGDDEALDETSVASSLDALSAGGETNYLSAVFAAAGTIQQQEAMFGDAHNVVYFLSDGNPFPEGSQPPFLLDIVSAPLHAQAAVHAVGVGSLVTDTTFLDPIDNTGGAQIAVDTGSLAAALNEAPMKDTAVLSATLNVFDTAGALVDSFQFSGAEFDETPIGFELSVESVAGLDFFVNETNTAELIVELDGDGDLIADSQVVLSVDIEGLLPESFDF